VARASATIALKTFAAAEKDIVCEADRRRAKNGWNLNSTYSHENRKTTTRKSAMWKKELRGPLSRSSSRSFICAFREELRMAASRAST